MDIEDLSKSQLLLLTILVNFVVAIATGVLTVALLYEGPTTVTQTVNRIVDHTIETVTVEGPARIIEQRGGPSTEELLTAALAESAARAVALNRSGGDTLLVAGVYLPSVRAVVTVGENLPNRVTVRFSDGTLADAERAAENGELRLYRFAADAALPAAPNASFVASADVKQGQTAIALGSDGRAITGIVSKVDGEGVYATLPSVPVGAGIVGLSGGLIGLSAGTDRHIPAERIEALIAPPAS